ncbi:unnamed protein product [Clavelina lepadiformis]|uniref:Uncharacterized protein n=1 Tax=Clavelina lepadiformis TaxID=159417 RepID=A0ABP0G110_CLALP
MRHRRRQVISKTGHCGANPTAVRGCLNERRKNVLALSYLLTKTSGCRGVKKNSEKCDMDS